MPFKKSKELSDIFDRGVNHGKKSTVSARGQVTIPAKVREALGLKPGDRVIYKVVGGKAEIMPIKGTILDAAGTVKPKAKPENFRKIRAELKHAVAKRIAEKKQ
ncbi:MAG: AbrB/MazE/SpoVT family DNA-binding domain-containing protein [Actinomycetota bacterium]|nr:AbrB/MazE/SpoVT family DNA-binding domain-containing protein [Actinomycetota bacterium]